MPVAGSKRKRRTSPESTTTRTPGMVRLVSAMLVASTTRREPGAGGHERRLLLLARRARRRAAGSAARPVPPRRRGGEPSSSARTRWISRAPGRNTSTSPCSSANARRTILAVSASGDSCVPRAGRRFGQRRQSLARIARRHREGPAVRRDDRRIAEQPRHGGPFQSRRHDQELRVQAPRSRAHPAPAPVRGPPAGSFRGTRRTRLPQPLPAPGPSAASVSARLPSRPRSACPATPACRAACDTPRCARPPLPASAPYAALLRVPPAAAAPTSGCACPPPKAHASSTSGTTVLFPAPGGAVSTADECSRSARRSSRQRLVYRKPGSSSAARCRMRKPASPR